MSTAPALVREVQAAGGQIAFADGCLKLSAPAPLPDGLVNELRAHKAEVLSFLQGRASSGWDAETAALIEWFLRTPPPPKPFELSKGVTVLRPGAFWQYLRDDLAAGPGVARGRTGALRKDLQRLAQLFGGPATVGES